MNDYSENNNSLLLKAKYIYNKRQYWNLINQSDPLDLDLDLFNRSNQIGGRVDIQLYDTEYTLESLDGEDNGYPYSKNFMPSPIEMMDNLKSIEFNDRNIMSDSNDQSKKILKRSFPSDHILSDSISNHFTETVRVNCQFNQFDTAKAAWDKNIKSEIKDKLNAGETFKYRGVFEIVYNNDKVRLCNTFNEAYCLWMIRSAAEKMGADISKIRLLDPSSGWGNRLIASYAAGIAEYRGYDPNSKLTPLYAEIIEQFGNNTTKAKIIEQPFEESEDFEDYYDIVLTSPPYFAYEVYDKGERQSVVKFPEYDEWVQNMYRPYLRKAYKYLRDGGIMIIYIEDIFMNNKKYPLSELTNDIMNELGGKTDDAYGLNVVYSDSHLSRHNKSKKRSRARYANSWVKHTTRIQRSQINTAQIKLGKISDTDKEYLLDIVADPEVMSMIGNGEVWSEEKLDRFIEYSMRDENKPFEERDNFYSSIMFIGQEAPQTIGIVAIHRVKYSPNITKDKFFLTVFIGKTYHRKGIGRRAIRLAVRKFIKKSGKSVYAHVRPDNIASARSLGKAGFIRDVSIDTKVKGQELEGYIFDPRFLRGGDSESENDVDTAQIKLGKITDTDKEYLLDIVMDPEVMGMIGNGQVWSEEKLDKLIEYSMKDDEQPFESRDNFYSSIVFIGQESPQTIGIVAVHKVRYSSDITKDKFFLTVFIGKTYHRKGIGRRAIRLAVKRFVKKSGKPVYAHVRPGNIASVRSLGKAGFIRDASIDTKVKGQELEGYIFDPRFLEGGNSESESDVDSETDIITNNSDSSDSKVVTVLPFIESRDIDMIKKIFTEKLSVVSPNSRFEWLNIDKPIQHKYADIMFLDGDYMYDKDLYNIKSDIRGIIMASVITNKIKLHQNVKDDFIPKTHIINTKSDFDFMNGKDWWIWRPEGGYSGSGIKYIKSQDDARKLQQELIKKGKAVKKKNKRQDPKNRALLSRVIENPLLYYPDKLDKGYKFHFRIYLMAYKPSKSKDDVKYYLFNKGEIFTTNVPYKHADFDNMGIHDTHQSSTIGSPTFPHDCYRIGIDDNRLTKSDCELILESMANIIKTIVSRSEINNQIKVYDETNAGYDILGCDFMIDKSGKVYLIEINDRIGYPDKTEDTYAWLNNTIANIMFDTVIGPRFFGTDPRDSERTVSLDSDQIISGGGTLDLESIQLNKTYIAKLDQLDESIFDTMIQKRGWKKIKYDKSLSTIMDPNDKIGLICLTGITHYDKRFWDFNSTMKSILMANPIGNKVTLHADLMKINSNAIPHTITVNPDVRPIIPVEGKSWIWRPEGGMMGIGISIITTQEELDELWKLMKLDSTFKTKKMAALTKYIDNPLLFEKDDKKYKFHLRMYLLIITDGVNSQEYLYRKGRLFHAKKEYVADNYDDKDIHDTHLKSSTPNLKFPDDYPTNEHTNPTDAFDKITQMTREIVNVVKHKIKPYPENDLGFQIFGIDAMVDDTGKPWLIEINEAPGLGDNPHMQKFLSTMLVGGLDDTVFAQIDGEEVKETHLVRL
jgi:RimJ/RimL family protein N-acetyltransferase